MKISEATYNQLNELLMLSFDCNARADNLAYNIDYSRIIQHKTGIDSKDNLCTNNEENEILLASDEKIVYACLRLEPKHMDEILYETQLGLSEVIRILFSLEEKNMVISNRNNYYSRIK